jgi:hypothetical protein
MDPMGRLAWQALFRGFCLSGAGCLSNLLLARGLLSSLDKLSILHTENSFNVPSERENAKQVSCFVVSDNILTLATLHFGVSSSRENVRNYHTGIGSILRWKAGWAVKISVPANLRQNRVVLKRRFIH